MPKMNMKLAVLILKSPMDQRLIAAKAGISPAVLSKIKNGWQKPTTEQAQAICKAIGCTMRQAGWTAKKAEGR